MTGGCVGLRRRLKTGGGPARIGEFADRTGQDACATLRRLCGYRAVFYTGLQ